MKLRLEDAIVRWSPRIVGALCLVVLALVGVAVYTLFQFQATNEQVDENQRQQVLDLRENQYINCVRSANALRRQVRREFVDLKRDILIPVFSRVAQTIPRGTPSRRILTGSVVYMHKRIRTIEHRIPNVDCAKRYPPLPGQNFGPIRTDRNGGGDARETQVRPSGESTPDGGTTPDASQPAPPGGGDPGGGGSGGEPGPTGPPSPPPTDPPSPPSPDPPPTPQPPPSPPPPPSQPTLGDQVGGAAGDTIDHVTGLGCQVTNALGICIR